MKYHNSKTANKYKQVIERLSKNNNVIIIKQDKGRGVIILDRTKYIDKCMSMVATKQFSKQKNYIMFQQINWKVKSKIH